MTTSTLRIGIIGAGISGLTVAYRLEQSLKNAVITVLESGSRVGGKIMTELEGDLVLERGPESVLSMKKAVMDLIVELGLENEIIARNPAHNKTYIIADGKWYRIPSGMSGLVPVDLTALEETSLISKEGMERFRLEPTIPKRDDDADESVASFSIRRFGNEIYEKIIDPLLGGIYGGGGDALSILATFPQLRDKEKRNGSILGGEPSGGTLHAPQSTYPPFVSLKQGMEVLTDTLAHSLQRTKTLLNTSVTAVEKDADTYVVTTEMGEQYVFDILVLTTPAFVNSSILKPLDDTLASLHAGIPYTSSTIVSFVYDAASVAHPLDGYGYITLPKDHRTVHAMTWSSRKWPRRAPEDTILVRAFLGGSGDAMLESRDEAIVEVVKKECRDMMGIAIEPRAYRIDRYKNAMPQYLVGHTTRVEEIEAQARAHDGLYLTGMTYHGVGIPDCIKSANETAVSIISKYGDSN